MHTNLVASPAYDLARLRELFQPAQMGIAYLNHAGMSPLCAPVKGAMMNAIEIMASQGSAAYASLLEPMLPELRASLGNLVGCAESEVAFVGSTSLGINIIANSLPLKPGDNVLLCDTEFPSNVYPWQNLRPKGIATRITPSHHGGLNLDILDEHRDSKTRIVAVSAVQFFSGKRENLYELGEFCRQHNLWLIVDAMQAVGIVPIDMQQMGIHALASGGQKALLGPPGQGFVAIRHELLEQMHPIFAGPVSVLNWENWLHYDLTFLPGARQYDMGTYDIAGIAGLNAAVQLLLELGPQHIADWVTHLSNIAIDDLQARRYRIVTPLKPHDHAHIVTFAVNSDPSMLVRQLEAHGVVLRAHEDALGNPYLRISSHAYNTEEEILRVGKVLGGINHE